MNRPGSVAKKGTGLSREPRIRAKQTATLDAYAEQVATIGGDPVRDRAAMVLAVERNYTRPQTEAAKVKQFMRLWKSDEARVYLCELWGLAMEPEVDQDPVSLAMRLLHTHAVQEDESWGPRDRGASLAAVRQMVTLFIPAQTTKIASVHMSTRIERPAEFDQEPVMASRTILPAGQTIAQPAPPSGGDEDPDDEGDDDDDD